MLRLRKVELFGFKSFADRTSIVFPGTGISAIVGPNGCGKSNIADAILWVLGEQSAKTLRSSRMADCIFNGTTGASERPPTNLAEVSLTLVDPKAAEEGALAEMPLFSPEETTEDSPEDAQQPETSPAASNQEIEAEATGTKGEKKPRRNRLGLKLEPGDIVITRRLYRDGKSEYYLNGALCRLRDIQEIFMGTGLGPQSYAIIEQGRIEQILSSRPSDRRALIEEAAGITKYKTRRRLAEGKLEATRQNLLRLNDILEEVTKQLGSLKRQASRARRYQEHKSESVALRRVLLATNLEKLAGEEAQLNEKITSRGEQVSNLSDQLSQLEEGQSGDQSRQFELETLVRQEQNRAGELMVALERTLSRLTDCRRQQEEAREQLERLATERQAHTEDVTRINHAIEQAGERLSNNEAAIGQLQDEIQHTTQLAAQLREQVFELETSLAGGQQQRTELVHSMASARAEAAQLEQSAEISQQKMGRLQEARAELEQKQQNARSEETAIREGYNRIRSNVLRAQEELTAAEQALTLCQQEFQEQKQLLESLRGRLAAATAQEEALNGLVKQRAAFADPVRKLLEGNGSGKGHGNGFHSVGVLADFAEFDPAYSDLIQTYLQDELEYVVVDTYDSARSGVSLLRRESSGHATFLVNSFHRAPVKMPSHPLPPPEGEGLIGPLGDFLQINCPLGNEAKKVLPRLASTYLVESAGAAETLATDYPQHCFLATDGTCYQGRLVSGGAPATHGVFTLQQDAEDAVQQRTEIEPQTEALAATTAKLAAGLVGLETERDAARSRLHQQEKELVEAEQRLMAATAQQSQATRNLDELLADFKQIEEQHRDATQRQAELQSSIAESDARQHQYEEELREKTGQLQQTRRQNDEAQPQLTELRSQRAALEERLTAGRAELSRLEEESHRQSSTWQAMDSTEERLVARQAELQQEEERLNQEAGQRREEKQAQENRCHQYDTEHDQLRKHLSEQEAVFRKTRSELDQAREERNTIEIERARLQSDRQHMENAVQGEFGLTGTQLREEVADRLAGEALAQAEERDRELRRKLDNIGPVNMMALEEFQECEQRHVFLTGQRDDLLTSMEDIKKTITELDEIAHTKFSKAFAAINQNFQETFQTLFGGGQSTLRLTEGDDPSEAGVELICQPPGKRLQNVQLLSGGEKALTALTLLISIFRYTPSPFCILDEVDAPLDDTNIGRFTKLVEEMALQTQFILVTHSKKTMESASILYGVTMQNAVSQIVSVRFEEAAENAA